MPGTSSKASSKRHGPREGSRATGDIRQLLLRNAQRATPATAGHGASDAAAAAGVYDEANISDGRQAEALDRLLAWSASEGAASPTGVSCAGLGYFAASRLGLSPEETKTAVSRLLSDGAVYETIENHIRVLEGHGNYAVADSANSAL